MPQPCHVSAPHLIFLPLSFFTIKWGQAMSHQVVVRSKVTITSSVSKRVLFEGYQGAGTETTAASEPTHPCGNWGPRWKAETNEPTGRWDLTWNGSHNLPRVWCAVRGII